VPLVITTLSENTAGRGSILGEWGLSILVETDEVNILFDTGKSFAAAYNADTLGIDLSRVDRIVLSHGHYDHTGGLREVLRRISPKKGRIEIVAHPQVWADKYSRREGQEDRFSGVPFQRGELENLGARFILSTEPVKITETAMTTGEVPQVTAFEDIPSGVFVKEGDSFRADDFPDDQALVIKTLQGLVIILGCAHRGMVNTLYHAQEITGVKVIDTVIGGSHLVGADEERVERTIAAIKELDVHRLGLCHCTSQPVAARMACELGDRFFFNNAGTRIELT
jgi:7,8-dihydropterin-6-yl-methyl-4-(beta-D-ribofuranosyl)aminobenzene 5'-phosphate synthase